MPPLPVHAPAYEPLVLDERTTCILWLDTVYYLYHLPRFSQPLHLLFSLRIYLAHCCLPLSAAVPASRAPTHRLPFARFILPPYITCATRTPAVYLPPPILSRRSHAHGSARTACRTCCYIPPPLLVCLVILRSLFSFCRFLPFLFPPAIYRLAPPPSRLPRVRSVLFLPYCHS